MCSFISRTNEIIQWEIWLRTMPGSVERWLQSFMCTQYAHVIESYGYKTLQAVSIEVRGFSIWPPQCLCCFTFWVVFRSPIYAKFFGLLGMPPAAAPFTGYGGTKKSQWNDNRKCPHFETDNVWWDSRVRLHDVLLCKLAISFTLQLNYVKHFRVRLL